MSKLHALLSFLRKNILQILSCIIFVLVLAITWLFFQKKHTFPEGIHIAIQEEFQKIVRQQLLKSNPSIRDIQFQELWTETTDQSKQIKTIFSYTFNDPTQEEPIKVTVRGFALIDRQKVNQNKEEFWKIGAFNVDQTEIYFNNELMIISPDDTSNPLHKKINDNLKNKDQS